MSLECFAIFNEGAYFIGPMTLCIISLWAVFIALFSFDKGNEYLANWRKLFSLPLVFLVMLWVWSGVSMAWSISADLTYTEFNRTGGYVAALAVGILLSASRTARKWAPLMFVGLVASAAVYGIGPKAVPSVIDNLENAARIAVPIGYANAMGLLLALGFPLALFIASTRSYHAFWRLIMVLAANVIIICLFFTASRGAILALVIGTLIYFTITSLRLRSFGVFALVLAPTMLIGWWSSGQDALMKDRVELGPRLEAAAALRLYLAVSVIAVVSIFIVSLLVGRKARFSETATTLAGGGALFSVISAVLIVIVLFMSSQPSVSDWAHQAYSDFTSGAPTQPAGAGRLIELGSSGRWQVWEEAIANWEDNPVLGTGAQSFPLVHLARRESEAVFVKQAHGLGFGLLSELGIVGFALAAAFIVASMTMAMLAWCRTRDRWERSLAAAIISVMVIYLVHTSFDWDWNMFGLTMIFFFFAGIMAGWARNDATDPSEASQCLQNRDRRS